MAINSFRPIFKDFPMTNFILLDSLNSIVRKEQANIYAFVIMKDHFHILWETKGTIRIDNLITSFRKYNGRMISNYLKKIDPQYQDMFLSDRQDRERKIWKISKGNINIYNKEMLDIKIKYTHNNPTKKEYKVVDKCTDYYFSSAFAYSLGAKNFEFLTVLKNVIPWC